MFEKAIRQKLRFNYKGVSTVEDLYDIPLTHLDEIYKGLNKELGESQGESLLTSTNTVAPTLELKIGLIKHVVNTRLEEKRVSENAKVNRERKQKILSIIADKQDTELQGKSVEELNKMIDEI